MVVSFEIFWEVRWVLGSQGGEPLDESPRGDYRETWETETLWTSLRAPRGAFNRVGMKGPHLLAVTAVGSS